MKKTVKSILAHPLMAGGAVISLGAFVGNIFNFLFNFFMTRNLSVEEYGTVAALISIILLFSLAIDSFIPTVVHFAGSYFANKEIDKAAAFFWKLNTFFLISGGIILGSFLIFSEQLRHFFKIDSPFLLFLVGIVVFFFSITTLNKGMLMGQLSFKYISFLNIFSAVIKFFSGVLFVLGGLKVIGALLAFIVISIFQYFFSFFPLRFVFKKRAAEIAISSKKVFAYAAPSAMAMLGLTLFITTDIILVRHFYTAKEAGIYAGMSLLGRIIFFVSAPMSTVLFPLVVQRHARNEKHKHLFLIAIGLVAISSLSITVFYYIFPEFSILLLLKQREYLSIRSTLWVFGIFMVLFSLLWLMTNYYLSLKKTKVFLPIIGGTIFQAVALWFYHSTFLTVISISIAGTLIPLCVMLANQLKIYSKTNGK